MDNYFLTYEKKDYFAELINEALEKVLQFKDYGRVLPLKEDSSEFYILDEKSDGMDCSKIIKRFNDEIVPKCTNFSNKGFMGFPDAGNSLAGLLGAFYADLLQQNLINESFCAPIATKMEIEVIKLLRKLAGYKVSEDISSVLDVGGICTYGGTGSNTVAMMLARENYNKNTMCTGIKNREKMKVIIPKNIGHYSIRSSLMWLGCGQNIIEVETHNYKYDLQKLEKTLKNNKGSVMAVVAYAGDSRTMSVDYLDKIANIVKKIDSDIWLHLDACHGFSLLFSEKHREKLNGIEMWDSISCDPHKVLALPYCCSVLLLKNPKQFSMIITDSDLIMSEDLALGRITPFIGSKSWVSLRLWFVIKNFGVRGIGELIDRRIELARYFESKISALEGFVVLNDVEINSVVFLYKGSFTDESDINKMNELLYERLKNDGKYYFHQFELVDDKGVINGYRCKVLRYMSGNNQLKEVDIDVCASYLEGVARELEKEIIANGK